jgi:hypothetical protein
MALAPLLAAYTRAVDRIAMIETASVAIIGTGHPSRQARVNNPAVDDIKRAFDGTLSALARKKHLAWVDSASITRESPDPEAMFLDELHKGQVWHAALAERVVAALLREPAYQSSQS